MSELIVYVSCADARSIVLFAMDPETGALTPRGAAAVPGPEGETTSMPLALSPDGRVLHAAVRLPPYPASSFAIDPATGTLTRIGGADLPHAMAYILVDPLGQNLLAASYPGGIFSSHAITPDGAVGPARQVIDTPVRPHAVATDAAGRYAYVPCLGADVVLQLALDARSGLLHQVGRTPMPEGSGPRHIRFSPDGRFAYVVGELDATVTAHTVDAGGGLARIQTVAMLPPGTTGRIAAADIQITPDGRFLYASERLTNILAAYRIDPADGTLHAIGQVPAEPAPRGFAIDPAGRFLLCAGQSTGAVGTYAIDQEIGALTRIATTHAGANANWIEFFATRP